MPGQPLRFSCRIGEDRLGNVLRAVHASAEAPPRRAIDQVDMPPDEFLKGFLVPFPRVVAKQSESVIRFPLPAADFKTEHPRKQKERPVGRNMLNDHANNPERRRDCEQRRKPARRLPA